MPIPWSVAWPVVRRVGPYVLAAILLGWLGYVVYDWIGDRREATVRQEYALRELEQRRAYEAALEQKNAMLDAFATLVQLRGEEAAREIAELQQQASHLNTVIRNLRLTQYNRGPAHEDGTCDVRSMSDDFRVCFAAAATRTPEAIAACEALGVHGEVRPEQ